MTRAHWLASPFVDLYHNDARTIPIPDSSVHCCVTSPPYWGLRDYGEAGQLGAEKTPEAYVANMVNVFREVRRVLRDDGTLWLNLGDSYGAGKNLAGIPWRVALALQADGWYLRSDIIWAKPNPMPESVRDRPTKAHEYLFMLTKSPRYFFDQEAVREASAHEYTAGHVTVGYSDASGRNDGTPHRAGIGFGVAPSGRNIRTVWTVATQPYKGAHFACFPPRLIEPCILAGTSAHGCCSECGTPWVRVVERTPMVIPERQQADRVGREAVHGRERHRTMNGQEWAKTARTTTTGWAPSCAHPEASRVPCTVLDPFMGSGTTAWVARKHGRRSVGVELNETYLELAAGRLRQAALPFHQQPEGAP